MLPLGSSMGREHGGLDFIEIYTYGNAEWRDQPQILSFAKSIHYRLLRRPANER